MPSAASALATVVRLRERPRGGRGRRVPAEASRSRASCVPHRERGVAGDRARQRERARQGPGRVDRLEHEAERAASLAVDQLAAVKSSSAAREAPTRRGRR